MTQFQKRWLMSWVVALATWALVIGQGCGVAPGDAADELEWSAAHPEEWCGWAHDNGLDPDVEKITIPDDYGNTAAPGGCNSTGAWPGGYCWVPASNTITWQVSATSGIPAWNLAMQAALNYWEGVVDPLQYWEITQVSSGGNFESRFDSTHPQGYLGSAHPASYFVIQTPQGDARLYEFCAAVLYKTHILANGSYQSASPAQQSKYINNLSRHEDGHCLGAMHHLIVNNTLMSISYTFPGPYFDSYLTPTAAEIQRIADYPF